MDPVVAQRPLPILKGAAPLILPDYLIAATDVAKQKELSGMPTFAARPS